MNALIIEDKPKSTATFKHFLEKNGFEFIVKKNYITALDFLNLYPNSIVFIDNDTGITILSIIKKLHPQTILITLCNEVFYTEHQNYINMHSDICLNRAIDKKSFQQTIRTILSHKPLIEKDDNRAIFLKIENNIIKKFNIEDIYWIHSIKNYCYIYCKNRKFRIRSSLKQLLSHKINHPQIIRVHQSYAINSQHIESFSRKLVFINNEWIPVSNTLYQKLIQKLGINKQNSI